MGDGALPESTERAARALVRNVQYLDGNLRRCVVSKLLRGAVAGWGATKLGGGCVTTILVFVLLWWLLGSFQIFQ